MSESFEHFNQQTEVEKAANFEGNHTMLFRERLQNAEVRKQLVDLLLEHQDSIEYPDKMLKAEKDGSFTEIPKSEWFKEKKTRDQIEKELEERIEKVFSVTNISFDSELEGSSAAEGDPGMVAILSKDFLSGQRMNVKQLGIIEAHEKGHGIRRFAKAGKIFEEKFLKAVDTTKFVLSEDLLKRTQDHIEKNKIENVTVEQIRENYIHYFTQTAEIVERMAQLRNYFGMKGSEEFTQEHLLYAKEHYLDDTGMGLQMKPFLDMVTVETEEDFLVLINSCGI